MKITWLGHASLRIEIGDQVLLVDPWLIGNPMFPDNRIGDAVKGVTHILVTHGHGDHTADVLDIAKEERVPIVGIADLMGHWADRLGKTTIGFNKGGTVMLGNVAVTMVHAVHSSSISGEDGGFPAYAGSEAGYMISHDGRTIYVSGDTDVMADMKIFNDLHQPEVGILCAGGHYTMDMRRATYAAREFFNFKTVIPYHYRTFPLLEQSAEKLREGLPGVDVIEPEVMLPITL